MIKTNVQKKTKSRKLERVYEERERKYYIVQESMRKCFLIRYLVDNMYQEKINE